MIEDQTFSLDSNSMKMSQISMNSIGGSNSPKHKMSFSRNYDCLIHKNIDKQKEKVINYCLEENCNLNQRLICELCLEQGHKGHNIEKISEIKVKLKEGRQKLETQLLHQIQNEQHQFEQLKVNFEKEITIIKAKFDQILDIIKEFTNNIKDQFSEFVKKQENIFSNLINKYKIKHDIDLSSYDIIHDKRLLEIHDKTLQDAILKLLLYPPQPPKSENKPHQFIDSISVHTKEIQEQIQQFQESLQKQFQDIQQNQDIFYKMQLIKDDFISQSNTIQQKSIQQIKEDQKHLAGNLKMMMVFSKIKMKLSLNLHGTLQGHSDDISAISKLDNRFIVSGGHDKKLILWDIGKQQLYQNYWLFQEPISNIVKMNDNFLIVASQHIIKSLEVVQNGNEIDLIERKKLDLSNNNQFRIKNMIKLNENELVLGCINSAQKCDLNILNFEEFKIKKQVLNAHSKLMQKNSLQKLDDNQFLSVAEDSYIKVFSKNLELLKEINNKGPISCALYLNDIHCFVVAQETSLKLYSIIQDEFKCVFVQKNAHGSWITDMVQAGQKAFITSSMDSIAKIWTIQEEENNPDNFKLQMNKEFKNQTSIYLVLLFQTRVLLTVCENKIHIWK